MVAIAIDIWPEAAFRPTAISGLHLWLDAADPATLFQDSAFSSAANINGDPVGGWRDKSGAGRHATGSGATRPTLVTGSLNGRPGVDFVNGSSQILTLASPTVLSQFTVCAVFAYDAVAVSKTVVGGGAGAFSLTSNGSHQLRIVKQNTGNVINQTSAGSTAAQVFIGGYESGQDPSGAQYPFRRNGASDKTPVSTQTMTANTDSVGGRSGADFMDGRIYELVVYNRLLSPGEYGAVEAYLRAKWGL